MSIRFHPWLAVLAVFARCGFAQDDSMRRAAELDAAHQCEEAERYYREALAKRPPSPALLNNTGNHYIACGQPDKAESYFQRLLQSNPAHPNANLQMARIAVERKQGARALQFLAHVQLSDPAVQLLRAEANWHAGRRDTASATLDALQREAAGDARVLMALGLTYARLGLYERAESTFTVVLAAHPGNFEVLLSLGKAAARAHHYDRAQQVLEVASKLRPADTETLLELGRVYAARQDYSRSVYVLAQARQQAPQRPDVLLALARAAEDAGYYGDSILAYDDYLRVQPADDAARRDRARVCAATGTRLAEGLKELTAYLQRHPDDPVGHFDLAQFLWSTQPDNALEHLSTAVRLDARFAPAYYGRGWLLQRLGRGAESIADFRKVVQLQPGNVRALDQLGLAYLSLDRPSDAEQTLRRAIAIAPTDPDVLLHLGRALIALDRDREAEPYLQQFEKLRPARARDPRREAGMIELATLPAEERRRREIERLRRDAASHPGDQELQLHLAELLLADGQIAEAAAAYRELLRGNAGARIWRRAGATLLRAAQYQLAREFLDKASAEDPAAGLDLSVALFYTSGAQAALPVLDKVPEADRGGDYLLMKARLLDAAGRPEEATELLGRGSQYSASQPEIAREAALLLIRRNRAEDAVSLLERAAKANPDHPDLLLARAIALAMAGQQRAAENAVKAIELRWPEWDRAYLAHGLLLQREDRRAEASQKMRTAVALGGAAEGNCKLSDCGCVSEVIDLLLPNCRTSRP